MFLKILFIIAAVAGVALVFVVSWFWTLLLVPMVIILGWDFLRDLFNKKKVK